MKDLLFAALLVAAIGIAFQLGRNQAYNEAASAVTRSLELVAQARDEIEKLDALIHSIPNIGDSHGLSRPTESSGDS